MTPLIFDRGLLRRRRDRAAARMDDVAPVLEAAAALLLDRLDDTTRRFSSALEIGGRGVVAPMLRARGVADVVSLDLSPAMAALAGGVAVAGDEEMLPFAEGAFDLVIASLSLHMVNDLPGALIQIRRALRPDGLFLASLPGFGSLQALREGWRAHWVRTHWAWLHRKAYLRGTQEERQLAAFRRGIRRRARFGFASIQACPTLCRWRGYASGRGSE
jgi:SAM-dependent methyltransferase